MRNIVLDSLSLSFVYNIYTCIKSYDIHLKVIFVSAFLRFEFGYEISHAGQVQLPMSLTTTTAHMLLALGCFGQAE